MSALLIVLPSFAISGGSTDGWAAAVAEEQAWHQDMADELAAEYGTGLGLTRERLMWAMGQVRQGWV